MKSDFHLTLAEEESGLFESDPRWPRAPKICHATNLPALDSKKELDVFLETNGPGVPVLKIFQCNVCDRWHAHTTAADVAGASSGRTRQSKQTIEVKKEILKKFKKFWKPERE